jgi:hypothetical protein
MGCTVTPLQQRGAASGPQRLHKPKVCRSLQNSVQQCLANAQNRFRQRGGTVATTAAGVGTSTFNISDVGKLCVTQGLTWQCSKDTRAHTRAAHTAKGHLDRDLYGCDSPDNRHHQTMLSVLLISYSTKPGQPVASTVLQQIPPTKSQ